MGKNFVAFSEYLSSFNPKECGLLVTLLFCIVFSIPAKIFPMADSKYYLIFFTKITQNPVFMVPLRQKVCTICIHKPKSCQDVINCEK